MELGKRREITIRITIMGMQMRPSLSALCTLNSSPPLSELRTLLPLRDTSLALRESIAVSAPGLVLVINLVNGLSIG